MTSVDTFGRQTIQIVEIVQDFCANTYGGAPCTAAIGVTGTRRCFNTLATCQDTENYALSPSGLVLRFCTEQGGASQYDAIPSLVSCSTVPTRISIGRGSRNDGPLGSRASVTMTFKDHADSDFKTDPYFATRGYDTRALGTFWTKWLARNPYFVGRSVFVYDGYVGQPIGSMRKRQYFIDRIDGPDANGSVKISANDVLRRVMNEQAKVPIPSPGTLFNAIGPADDDVTVINAPDDFFAGGYDLSDTVRINDELISYTTLTDNPDGTKTLSGLIRGAFGTTATGHEVGDTVQQVVGGFDLRPDQWARAILEFYCGIDAAFFDDWDTEGETWLGSLEYDVLLTQPENALTVLQRMVEAGLFYIWWDEVDQLIKMRAIRPQEVVAKIVNDNSAIIADSQKITRRSDDRVSAVDVAYRLRNPVDAPDRQESYRNRYLSIDPDAESAQQYGERRYFTILSPFIRTQAHAAVLATRTIAPNRDTPTYLQISVDAKDNDLKVADVIDVTTRLVVNDIGESETIRYQIIEVTESEASHQLTLTLQRYQFGVNVRYGTIMEFSAPNYTFATPEQQASGCWIADANGKMSDGSDGYRII